MRNSEIARILENIADILELQEVQWKPQAYRKVAMSIESLTEDVSSIHKRGELKQIPGVGDAIAEKLTELIETGKLMYYEKLKKKIKIDIEGLKQIPSLGPRKMKTLYRKLGIKNMKDLEKAIRKRKVQQLPGFGEETAKNFLEGIRFVKRKPKRFLYAHVKPIVDEIKETLGKIKEVSKVEIAGSFRRGKETIGDLDFLVVSKKPEVVMKAFTSMSDVKKVIARGTTKSSVLLSSNLQVDLRVVKDKEFGSAMNYFIGSKQHNVELRKDALKKGYSLSEYGLFRLKNGKTQTNAKTRAKKWVAGRTEEDIYKKLGMQYVPPELRENTGEIAVSLQGKLPKLVENKDIKGIFHNHTKWSDGDSSILEMAQRAEELRMKFISFNDHSGTVGITNPVTERRLNGYLKAIEKVRKRVGIRVFSGLEIDILKNGKMFLPARQMKKLDVVFAAVHTSLRMKEEEMTKRVCSAQEDYCSNGRRCSLIWIKSLMSPRGTISFWRLTASQKGWTFQASRSRRARRQDASSL